jgi:hypothetical protein
MLPSKKKAIRRVIKKKETAREINKAMKAKELKIIDNKLLFFLIFNKIK